MSTQQKPKPKSNKRRPPATTPEARENQMINLAMDLAERQLEEGTASSQLITHFVKLAATKERIEKEILEEQKKLIVAKTEAIESSKREAELFEEAIRAMRSYQGASGGDDRD